MVDLDLGDLHGNGSPHHLLHRLPRLGQSRVDGVFHSISVVFPVRLLPISQPECLLGDQQLVQFRFQSQILAPFERLPLGFLLPIRQVLFLIAESFHGVKQQRALNHNYFQHLLIHVWLCRFLPVYWKPH